MIWRLLVLYQKIRSRQGLAFGFVSGLLALSILGNAFCFWWFDRGPEKPIGFDDALWYSVISITTIGYGDFYAESVGARLGTLVFIVILGLGTFTVFLGMAIDAVSAFIQQGQRGMRTLEHTGHVLIVNFPSLGRIRQIIHEIKGDPAFGQRPIALVTDRIERLPASLEGICFVYGSPLESETFERAAAHRAGMAIVLSPSYDDPTTDAMVASAVAVLDSMNGDLKVVAECIDEKHLRLFEASSCNAIVSGLEIAGNLMVQEASDPGVNQLVRVITSNRQGSTLYSTALEDAQELVCYGEVAKHLLDHSVNLMCVNRGPETITDLKGHCPKAGDVLVYVADRRRDWDELKSLACSG